MDDNAIPDKMQKLFTEMFQKKMEEFNMANISKSINSGDTAKNNLKRKSTRAEEKINKKIKMVNNEATHALVLWVGGKIKKHSVVPMTSIHAEVVEGI
jgi:hypothetical protein